MTLSAHRLDLLVKLVDEDRDHVHRRRVELPMGSTERDALEVRQCDLDAIADRLKTDYAAALADLDAPEPVDAPPEAPKRLALRRSPEGWCAGLEGAEALLPRAHAGLTLAWMAFEYGVPFIGTEFLVDGGWRAVAQSLRRAAEWLIEQGQHDLAKALRVVHVDKNCVVSLKARPPFEIVTR